MVPIPQALDVAQETSLEIETRFLRLLVAREIHRDNGVSVHQMQSLVMEYRSWERRCPLERGQKVTCAVCDHVQVAGCCMEWFPDEDMGS